MWALTALLIAVPAAVVPNLLDSFNRPKLVFWLVGAAVALVGISRSRVSWRSTEGRLLLAVLGWSAIATVFSVNPLASLFGIYTRYDGLLTLALGVVTAWLYANHEGERALWGIRVSAFVVAGVALAQQVGLDPFGWSYPGGGSPSHPISTLGNSNFAGAWLAITAPAVMVWAGRDRLRLVAFAPVVVALGLTGSRGAILGFAAAAAVLGVAHIRARPAGWRSAIALGTVVGALAVGALAYGRVDTGGISDTETSTARIELWVEATRLVRANPLLGTGPDTFYEASPPVRTRSEAVANELRIADKPHNVPLEKFQSTGIVGGIAWILLMLVALTLGWRRRTNPVARIATAMLVAHLVTSLFSINIVALNFVGWVAIGLIWGSGSTGDRPISAVLPTAGATVCVALAVALAISEIGAVSAYRNGRADAGLATTLAPWEPAYRSVNGFLAGLRGDERGAVEAFEQAHDLQPGNISHMISLAEAAEQSLRRELSEPMAYLATQTWGDAMKHDPLDPALAERAAAAHRRMGQQLVDQSYARRAIYYLLQAVEADPSRLTALVALGQVANEVNDRAHLSIAARKLVSLRTSDEGARLVIEACAQHPGCLHPSNLK